MTPTSLSLGITIGVMLCMASLGAAAAARYRTDTNGIDDPGHATNADRRSAGAWALAGAALLLTML